MSVSGRNLNSSKLSCISSLQTRMRMIDSKMKELECSQDFSHYKSMRIFPDAQGQLTPKSLVRSGRISNSSEMLWMFSLPASMKKIRLKMKEDIITFNLISNLAFRTMGVFFVRSKPCLKSINRTITFRSLAAIGPFRPDYRKNHEIPERPFKKTYGK